ncbi:flagellar export chaperone FliS [Pseudomonas chlororaphis subsp. aurantiaca]|uniref:flagellar export chaperone FliS n=1 Tax=Pseudomonas chlororaphis TaxID=587753 RepID=UPI0027DBF0EF|nr:flagellar export chaperone FliS [Pseudomonas chlororaphis]WMI97616.1 flagellar export chaperone FliS [Pseudomonas chlororaphis subsp. aurantiaca]
MNEGYESYRAVDLELRVSSASPYELVLVLFDGLLDELNRARGHIEAKHYELKGQSLEKCINIINALNSTLEYEDGGELVQSLSRLYDYCLHRLVDVSVSLSITGLDEVAHILGQMREGWEGAHAA